MKADIHPKTHPVVFVDISTGSEYLTTSTLTSDETKKINGVDHHVIKVEISSSSHPFYTGKRKLIDTAGRVDKFMERAKKAKELQAKNTKKVDEDLDEILHEEEEEKKEETVEEVKEEEVTEEKPEEEKPAKKEAKAKAKKTAKKAVKKTTK